MTWLVGRKRECSYCPYCPQPHPSTYTTWSRPHSLKIIRHCELIYGILEGMYKDLVFEHKITFMEILPGVAWPSPLYEDGNLDVFLAGTFDDNIQDMLLDRVEALSCDFQALSRFPNQSLETPAAYAGQVSPTAFSQTTVVLQVALYPSSMLWSQSSQRYQAGSCLHAHPFIWIKATDFHRECLQASKVSKGWATQRRRQRWLMGPNARESERGPLGHLTHHCQATNWGWKGGQWGHPVSIPGSPPSPGSQPMGLEPPRELFYLLQREPVL